MISEVPLGAFLSGGVDSSAVVAMMAGLSDGPVNTCSISFDDPAFDESAFAQQVAERYRTRHFVDRVETRRLRPDRHAGAPVRRAVCRQLGDPDLPRLPAGAQARDGGAVGRRRRRELRRLPALPPAPDAKSACARALPLALRRPLFGLLGRAVSEGRLGAARVARQDDLRGAGARLGRGVLPQRVDLARRHARRSCSRDAFKRAARRLPRDRGVPRARGDAPAPTTRCR